MPSTNEPSPRTASTDVDPVAASARIPDERRTRLIATIGAGILLAGAIGIIATLAGGSGGGNETTAEGGLRSEIDGAISETTTTTAPALATTEAPTTTEPPTTTESPTTESPTTEAPAVDPPPAESPEVAGNRVARLRGGVLTLEGVVPSEEIGRETEARAAAILGAENVINNYTIDPTIPYLNSGPLVVEDRVLFSSGSTRINPEFVPLLDLGTALLNTFPQVTITVVAHTDAVGDADMNLELSQRRGETVAAYWTSRGVDPARIRVDARGESDLLVATEEAEVANRRVEFVITGLLD